MGPSKALRALSAPTTLTLGDRNMGDFLYKKYEASLGRNRFEIEQDAPGVGWYLRVFEGDKSIADHLHDTLEATIEHAKEDYGVSREAWTEI